MGKLNGRVAIITGAAKGLGAADAAVLVREGATVVIADIDEREGISLAESLGPLAQFARLDVCDEENWIDLIRNTEAEYGGLDILVNNAGIAAVTTPESISLDVYRRVMGISMEGTVLGCKHGIGAMRRRGGGAIVNMSSIAAMAGEGNFTAYCAAKAAVESYTRAVAVYCAQMRLRIRCNTVNPAMADTALVRAIPAEIERMAHASPEFSYPMTAVHHNAMVEPSEVAEMVLYLVSDEARSINGQRFVIDNSATITLGVVPPLEAVA